jgi:WD40 repeat protein
MQQEAMSQLIQIAHAHVPVLQVPKKNHRIPSVQTNIGSISNPTGMSSQTAQTMAQLLQNVPNAGAVPGLNFSSATGQGMLQISTQQTGGQQLLGNSYQSGGANEASGSSSSRGKQGRATTPSSLTKSPQNSSSQSASSAIAKASKPATAAAQKSPRNGAPKSMNSFASPFASYRHLRVLDGHTHNIYGLAATSNDLLVSASYDNSIRVWNPITRACSQNFAKCHAKGITCLILISNGNIITGGIDNCIKQWDCSSGDCVSTISNAHGDYVYRLARLTDDRIVSGGGDNDKKVKLWDLESGRCLAVLEGHTGGIRAILQLQDGWIASGSWDNTIRLTDISKITASPMNTDSEFGSSSEDSIAATECPVRVIKGHPGAVYALVQLGSGYIASGSGDKNIRLWNVSPSIEEGKELVREMKGHAGSVICLCVFSDGTTLASGSHDSTIRLWDTSTGSCLKILAGHSGYVNCLTVLSDGITVASGSYDHTIRLWGS